MPPRAAGPSVLLLFLLSGCDPSGGSGDDTATPDTDTDTQPTAGVRHAGRFDDTDASAVRLSWSGTGFALDFIGTGARATLRGGRYFTVVLDGEVQPDPLAVSDEGGTYELASDLPDGEHTLEVYRRPSAQVGPTVVGAVEVDGELLYSPVSDRQVEIVSDSWATGYGVDGPEGCNYTVETENHYLAWGAIAARAVGAELSNISYGGIGVVRNGDSVGDPMVLRYGRVIATEPESTGTIRPADVVFVAIGANDIVDGQLPADFTSGYATLLGRVRTYHPDALIACVWPRLPDPGETQRVRSSIEEAIAVRADAGDTRVQAADLELEELVDFGCDDHPGKETHALMADNAVEFLEAELGW